MLEKLRKRLQRWKTKPQKTSSTQTQVLWATPSTEIWTMTGEDLAPQVCQTATTTLEPEDVVRAHQIL